MDCPRCAGSLVSETHWEITFESCGGCGGRWLDPGELRTLLDALAAEGKAPPPGAAPELEDAQREASGGGMKCPGCAGRAPTPKAAPDLEAFVYAVDTGIELDRCPACDGVWLDGGELERIQAFVAENAEKLRQDSLYFTAEAVIPPALENSWLLALCRALAAPLRRRGGRRWESLPYWAKRYNQRW